MDVEEQKFRVEVVRPCFLRRKEYGREDIGAIVPLPLGDAQDAIASGRCREVDTLPRMRHSPF